MPALQDQDASYPLLTLVLDHLRDDGDTLALLAASGVCREWTPLARRRLRVFTDVRIGFGEKAYGGVAGRASPRSDDSVYSGEGWDGNWDDENLTDEGERGMGTDCEGSAGDVESTEDKDKGGDEVEDGDAVVVGYSSDETELGGFSDDEDESFSDGDDYSSEDDEYFSEDDGFSDNDDEPLARDEADEQARAKAMWARMEKEDHPSHAAAFLRLIMSPQSTVLPHIRRLRVKAFDKPVSFSGGATEMLIHLFSTLPALRELELEDTRLLTPSTAGLIFEFQQLTSLSLTGMRFADDIWILITGIHSLTSLTIKDSRWPSPALLFHETGVTLDTLACDSRALVRLFKNVPKTSVGYFSARKLLLSDLRPQDHPALNTCLPRIANLATLHVDFSELEFRGSTPRIIPFVAAVDLSLLPTVTELVLADHCGRDPYMVIVLQRALLRRAPPALEQMTISLTMRLRDIHALPLPWHDIDPRLARRGLRAVKFELRDMHGKGEAACSRAAAAVRAALPLVDAQGILQVVVTAAEWTADGPVGLIVPRW